MLSLRPAALPRPQRWYLPWPRGEVADSRCHRSWVRPKYRLTYEDGDELIELVRRREDLAELALLLKQRMRWRLSRGAIGFDRPKGASQHVEGPELQVIEPSAARLMVSEAMLLMGAVVAEIGRREQLVLPFRSQPPSELPTQQELNAVPEGPARDAAIKRCLNRGVQGTRPMPHFSLGLNGYVQATSPIRRYADLLAHRQLIAWIQASPALNEAAISEQLAPRIPCVGRCRSAARTSAAAGLVAASRPHLAIAVSALAPSRISWPVRRSWPWT